MKKRNIESTDEPRDSELRFDPEADPLDEAAQQALGISTPKAGTTYER